MATALKTKVKTSKPRTTPRVTHDEGHKVGSHKSAKHRTGPHTDEGMKGVLSLIDGELFVTAQLSEITPVAQFAGITLGPVGIAYKVGGVDMESLIDVEWPDDPEGEAELTEEQAAAFDRAFGAVQAGMRVLESVVSTDRVSVERSVQQHNQREEAESEAKKAKPATKKPAAKKTKPSIGRK